MTKVTSSMTCSNDIAECRLLRVVGEDVRPPRAGHRAEVRDGAAQREGDEEQPRRPATQRREQGHDRPEAGPQEERDGDAALAVAVDEPAEEGREERQRHHADGHDGAGQLVGAGAGRDHRDDGHAEHRAGRAGGEASGDEDCVPPAPRREVGRTPARASPLRRGRWTLTVRVRRGTGQPPHPCTTTPAKPGRSRRLNLRAAAQRPHLRGALELDGDVPRQAPGRRLAAEAGHHPAGERGVLGDPAASASASSCTSPSSYAAQASPSATARSPSTSSPKSPRAAAASRPATRLIRVKWPPPGWMPIWAKPGSSRAVRETMRRSVARARLRPAPTAAPRTAATVGTRDRRRSS